MKATAPRNLPGRYNGSIPGPLSVNPTLAWIMKIKSDAKKGSMGSTSKKGAKADDSRMGVSQLRKFLEKIDLRKGAAKRAPEVTAPAIRVFHGYLLVCSMDETFE